MIVAIAGKATAKKKKKMRKNACERWHNDWYSEQ
jgi:hypothetical protein